ncbi:MAG: DUF1566 domain-containing protein [Betaproteobacteria bacterium]|nr:DUF1566 domain-containing protein [Betaproteobacteria bacterium]
MRALLLILFALFALPARAGNFTDNGDGTVTDTRTGLVWMRCALGQTWSGTACTGTAAAYSWDQAASLTLTYAGRSDWRLPWVRELHSIVDYTTFSPAIDGGAFPATPSSYFWSESPNIYFFCYAWSVDFYSGGDSYSRERCGDTTRGHVRLVRREQYSALLDDTRPTGDYVDHGDGTATHTPTGLTWMRCALGQAWNGTTCTGATSTYTWDQAKALTQTYAGHSDWRLPDLPELRSLVDYLKTPRPAINDSLFPATPDSGFWSGSPIAGYSDLAWYVNFYFGGTGSGLRSSYDYALSVRLVRSGQQPGSPPGQPTITSITAGSGRATIHFTPPANTGGSPITGYTASCAASGQTTRTATGSGSPLTVRNLIGGVAYQCAVAATNSGGSTGAVSAAVPVTPAPGKKGGISSILMLLLD